MALSHPQHYAVTRPYASILKRIGESPQLAQTILGKMGVPTEGDFTKLKAIMLSCLNEIAPLEKNGTLPKTEETNLWMRQEPHDAQVYTMFCGSGRMIFNFSEELTEAFNHSDIGEAAVKDIKLPFQAFYLKFNFKSSPIFYNGRPFDGAYIFQGKGTQFIGLLLVSSSDAAWPDILDLGIHSSFDTFDGSKLLSVALDETFLSQIKRFEEMDIHAANTYGIRAENIDHPQEDFFRTGHALVKSLFNLIGNALLYLSIYPDDVELKWPSNAPKALIEKAESTKPKERRLAYDELWAQGYAKIRYCKTYSPEESNISLGYNVEEDKKIAKHWRRGHWRNQSYGLGLRERRLVWIKPCLVGTIEKLIKGREYQVE